MTAMKKFIKIIAIIFVIIVILSLVMVAAGIMDWKFFWVIIIMAAFIAYVAIPWLKKRAKEA
ncbi:hypothetical protein KY346_06325 [Candidatus Woesearchaeota archaeon]|nr:hypothetical protein [Candidatus Woesearchaeota archaeon]